MGHPHCKVLPHIQVEDPVHQFLPVASCPIWQHQEEDRSILLTPSLHILTDIDVVSSQSSLLNIEQAQFPQPFLIRKMFQFLNHLQSSLLITIQEFHVSLVLKCS